MTRVLFLCGRNRRRSPTAERLFAAWPGLDVASAGISEDADVPVTPELLQWADVIFVMEQSHRAKLSRRFRPHLGQARLVCLHIPDRYPYMDERLVGLLQASVPRLLGRAGHSA